MYDRVALEKHIYVATRAERIKHSKHWILKANAEGRTQQSLNQRTDFVQANRECKRLHDEHLARTQQNYRDIPRSQQICQREGQQFDGNEENDYAIDPKTGRRFCKGSRANLQTASSSSSKWYQTHCKTSIWNSQQSSSRLVILFNRVRTSFGSPEINFPTTDGVCAHYTHNTARTELHSMITFHHGNTRGSRAGSFRIAHLTQTYVVFLSNCLETNG